MFFNRRLRIVVVRFLKESDKFAIFNPPQPGDEWK